MTLDYHTLFLTDLISQTVFAFALVLMTLRFRRTPGAWWFACSLGLAVAKTTLQMMGNVLPSLITVMLSNQANVFGFACMYLGFRRFLLYKPQRRPHVFLLIIAAITIFVYPIVFSLRLPWSFAVAMLPVCMACVASIWVLVRTKDAMFRMPARIGAGLLGAHMVVMLYRIVLLSWVQRGMTTAVGMTDQRRLVSMMALMAIDMGLPLIYFSLMVGEMQRELRREATTDALTGALNRRALVTEAEREVEVSRQTQSELSLLLIDVDEFKQVNDRHGHAVGDLVLTSLVRQMSYVLPQRAMLARSGGEEFAVLLPRTGLLAAYEVAERLRQSVEEYAIAVQERSLSLTICVGVAAFSGSKDALEKMLGRADAAMYQAKERGRNCVCVDQSEPTLLARTMDLPEE